VVRSSEWWALTYIKNQTISSEVTEKIKNFIWDHLEADTQQFMAALVEMPEEERKSLYERKLTAWLEGITERYEIRKEQVKIAFKTGQMANVEAESQFPCS
jgi:hypothetical protein